MTPQDRQTVVDMIRFHGLSAVLREIAAACTKEATECPKRDRILWESANKAILSATLKIAVD